MRMMKKLTVFALVCVTALSLALPVLADVIIEPSDAFYAQHSDECEYQQPRRYIVNTEEGHAYLYVSPVSTLTVKGYPNGEQISISWLYTDKNGDEWGLISHETGWFRMSELTVVYDSVSFLEEHKHEMTEYVKGTYTLEASEEMPIPMWAYPHKMRDSYFYSDDIAAYVQTIYTDAEGVVWGYISYYMGTRNVWVCLSDPYREAKTETATGEDEAPAVSEEVPTVTVGGAKVELKAEPTPADEIPASAGNVKILAIVGALVGVVVLVTAAVTFVLFAAKKRQAKKKAS